MDYKAIILEDAEAGMDRFEHYLILEKKNEQAACNLIDDFESTIDVLNHKSLKLCENKHLKDFGYRRIDFMSHR